MWSVTPTDSLSDRTSCSADTDSDSSGKAEPVQQMIFIQNSAHVLALIDFHDACYGRVEILESMSREQLQAMQSQTKHFISQRPFKRVAFEPALSFLMGPNLLHKAKLCETFDDLTDHLLGFSTKYKFNDDTWVLFKLLDANEIDIRSSTLTDLCDLLVQVHSEAGRRLRAIIPHFQQLIGEDKFTLRRELFEPHWSSWKSLRECMWHGRHTNFPCCGCRFPTLDDFVEEFDSVFDERNPFNAMVSARRMLFLQFNCNEFFGMDGFTYSTEGLRTGEEFLAINRPLLCKIACFSG